MDRYCINAPSDILQERKELIARVGLLESNNMAMFKEIIRLCHELDLANSDIEVARRLLTVINV